MQKFAHIWFEFVVNVKVYISYKPSMWEVFQAFCEQVRDVSSYEGTEPSTGESLALLCHLT